MSDRVNSPSVSTTDVSLDFGSNPLVPNEGAFTAEPFDIESTESTPIEVSQDPLEISGDSGDFASSGAFSDYVEKVQEETEAKDEDLGKTDQAFFRITIGGKKVEKEEKDKKKADKKKEDESKSTEEEEGAPPDSDNPLAGRFSATKDFLSGDIGVSKTSFDFDTESGMFADDPPEDTKFEISDKVKISNPSSDIEEAQKAPRSMQFDSRYGQVLDGWVRLDTHRHNEATFILFDPSDELRLQLEKLKNVTVEIGFVQGKSRKVFEGVLYRVGRSWPDGCIMSAVDESYQLKSPDTGMSDKRTPVPKKSASDRLVDAVLEEGEIAEDTNLEEADAEIFDVDSVDTDGNVGTSNGSLTDLFSNARTGASSSSDTLDSVLGEREQGTSKPVGDREKKKASRRRPSAEAALEDAPNTGLKYEQEGDSKVDEDGETRVQQGKLDAITKEAALEGKKVSVRDGKLAVTDPGKEPSSGVVLDFKAYPDLIIGRPKFWKGMGVMLKSGYGGVAIAGTDIAGKQTVGAIAVNPAGALQHPTGVINPPEWGTIKLSDPIEPGLLYTWADATKNGARVPQTKEIMGGIIRIARIITQYTEKVGKGKWRINSWYRDPATNKRIGGASASRHLSGDAVDYYYAGMMELYKELNASWNGGIAISPGSFIHIDDRGSQGKPRSRWTY